MPILGELLKKSVLVTKLKQPKTAFEVQKSELKKILKKARNTEFGKYYHFEVIRNAFNFSHEKNYFHKIFKENIPIHTYNKIYKEWWHRTLKGEKDICWPGIVKYFALTSGSSESSSKHIPITRDMHAAIKNGGVKQMVTLQNFCDPKDILTKGVLMLGGSTDLFKKSHYYEGDLSGIMTGKLPFWVHYIYKPGKKIAKTRDWQSKLDKITQKAPEWDMGYVAGVPAWMLLLFERIIKVHGLNNIHDIWPNLQVYAHGGVAFEPYKNAFEKLLGKPLVYIETYLASEGFVALQFEKNKNMQLLIDNGIFFEFVPFDEHNFDEDGEILPGAQALLLDQVQQGKEYALLLTTVAGAWRYLIGDVVKFTDVKNAEIIISGRTKQFLSLCGEHLSVDNMNRAIILTQEKLNIGIKEFTVFGESYNGRFAHRWHIASDDTVNINLLKNTLDQYLKELNDDYKTERIEALAEIFVEVLPSHIFYQWLKMQGKEGGQNKFPRVLKGDKLKSWQHFLSQTNTITQT
ncbi:MAG: GH3 auxin-responsive promoter family protein [Cytophagales bacterium]|nr:GH3 auxin-responsive promoter family protein [Cytophagales bacterium]